MKKPKPTKKFALTMTQQEWRALLANLVIADAEKIARIEAERDFYKFGYLLRGGNEL